MVRNIYVKCGLAWSTLPLALQDFIAIYLFCIPASITSCQYIKYDLKCTCLNYILAPRSRLLGRLWPADDDDDDDDDDENGFCLIRA